MNDINKAVRVSTRMAQKDTDSIAQHAMKGGATFPEMTATLIQEALKHRANRGASIDATVSNK